jgi:ribosomal protein S18 acetylase RimI-like enzyme
MPKITYFNGSTNAYSGHMEAAIYVDGNIVGAVEYVLYDDELTVSNIHIKPEFRR